MRALLPRTLLGRTVMVLIMTVALSQLATQLVFRQFVAEQYSRQLLRVGSNNLVSICLALRALPPASRQSYADAVGGLQDLRIFPVNGREGPPVTASEVLPERLQRLEDRLIERLGPTANVLLEARVPVPHVWVRLPLPDGDWWVQFSRIPFDRNFPLSAALLLGTSLVLAVAVAWLTVRRLNEPLRQVQRNILALSVGAQLPHRVASGGPAEISDLAQAVERTAASLRQNEQERALLLAGVSHDLRTPLSRLRLAVEMLADEHSEEQQGLVGDIEAIDRIIDQFLDFARNPDAVAPVVADLSDVARDCGGSAALHLPGLVLELAPDLHIAMRRPALDRLIANLLENARRYAEPPIVLRTARVGDEAVLSVLDRGPGIPEDQVERLLQPFTRLDASRTGPTGAGLGLAIVERIARAHGTRLELLPNEGGGLHARIRFTLVIPAAS
jgi:two-component system osmolarity sensor histidine kinase EnvZ